MDGVGAGGWRCVVGCSTNEYSRDCGACVLSQGGHVYESGAGARARSLGGVLEGVLLLLEFRGAEPDAAEDGGHYGFAPCGGEGGVDAGAGACVVERGM